MAIALDAFVDITTTTGTSLTYSHTVAGANRLIIADSICTSDITGVTYNGVALTFINSVSDESARVHKLWYLIAPATGANNLVYSVGSSVFIRGTSASYTGCDQTTPIDDSDTATSATSPVGPTETSTVDGDWGVGSFRSDTGTQGNGTMTLRAVANSLGYMDTNGSVGAAGNYALNFTISSGNGYVVAALIKPAAAAASASASTMMMMGV